MDRKPKIADHSTWCDDSILGGVNLAKILNDIGDRSLVRKVNTHVQRFNTRANAINHLDKPIRTYYMHLLFKDARNAINDAPFPTNVKTHLDNLLTAKFRTIKNKI